MKMAVCCDEMSSIDEIKKMLCNACEKNKIHVDFCNSHALFDDIEQENFDYDIVILDMHYRGIKMDGIGIGSKLNRIYPYCQIIYLVDDYDCIPKIYELKHCYLMRKADVEFWIDTALKIAVDNCSCHYVKGYLELVQNRRKIVLSQTAVTYIERKDRMVVVWTDGSFYEIYSSIREMSTRLSPTFSRCHGSFIVNMSYILQTSRFFCDHFGDFVCTVQIGFSDKFRNTDFFLI